MVERMIVFATYIQYLKGLEESCYAEENNNYVLKLHIRLQIF